jgi:hypothetical protein
MKFSALLPTRNRLDYLKYAVATVRRQDDPNWELIVSDNDSEDDIRGFVASLGDDRVRYVRTDRLVPVTENWNNALRHSSGDYVVMLGDDDALLPGYFSSMRARIEEFSQPDVIYANALLYAYPGVMPDAPHGYLQPYGYARFMRRATRPFVLDQHVARGLVREAMDFRVRYGFNMQFALVGRSIIEEISNQGDFYRSPFPDYYAMNMLFLRARSIVVEPRPSVVIGVTPKSYGFYHVKREEAAAREFLNAGDVAAEERLTEVLLPGTNINTGWLLAMEAVRADAGDPDLQPNHRRYRMLQILYVYEHHHLTGTVARAEFDELRAHLRPWERFVYGAGAVIAKALRPLIPKRLRAAIHYAYTLAQRQTPHFNPGRSQDRYDTILDVFDALDRDGRVPTGVS